MAAPPLIPLILAPLLVWRFYQRFRSHMGRQPVQPRRMIVRVVILAGVAAMIAYTCLQHPPSLEGLGGGLIAGGALGMIGLHFTRFERDETGSFYYPNARIGIALTLLFVCRIVYRMIELYAMPPNAVHVPVPALQSPLTFLVFGLVAGYYITYYTGILVRSRDDKTPS